MQAYEIITDRILEKLEQGVVPWQRPWRVTRPKNFVTGKHLVLRLIGDRYEMDHLTTTWDKKVIDRGAFIQEWADMISLVASTRGLTIYAYANNHFAGHGPETASELIEALDARSDSK